MKLIVDRPSAIWFGHLLEPLPCLFIDAFEKAQMSEGRLRGQT
jgi:hypothetical protein